MAELFGHEKLVVYQKGIEFAERRNALLAGLSRRVAACDHLVRGGESILINIAHASNVWSPKERMVYLGHANGSALECAACLDVLQGKGLLCLEEILPGKQLLHEIVSILIAMRKTTTDRIGEEHATYRTKNDRLFNHEGLIVYQTSLQISVWVEKMLSEFSCSADLLSKIDKATTAIPLNIAEGTGRFSGTDQAKFFNIAYKATVQSSALIDLAAIDTTAAPAHIEKGRNLLRRTAAMLTSLSNSAINKNNSTT
jgi:four helix bundle protein